MTVAGLAGRSAPRRVPFHELETVTYESCKVALCHDSSIQKRADKSLAIVTESFVDGHVLDDPAGECADFIARVVCPSHLICDKSNLPSLDIIFHEVGGVLA